MAPEKHPMLRVSQLAILVLASAAAAAAPCPEQDRGTLEEWKCYGEVEYASRAEGEADFSARFTAFANGERLHEKRTSAGAKTRLMGEGWSLYRGFGREDSTVVGRHDPLLFFEFALWGPLVVLAASGRAPPALAPGTTPVLYAGEGSARPFLQELGIRSVRGRIERSGTDYLFAAESVGNVPSGVLHLSLSGRWSPEPVAPWPDSMALDGWQYHCKPAGVDVRGNHRPVPPGVTLGEVRRGWKGPCG
jgi:hypothetical protein